MVTFPVYKDLISHCVAYFFLILDDKTCYDHVKEQIIMSCGTEMWNLIDEYSELKRCRCVCSDFLSK